MSVTPARRRPASGAVRRPRVVAGARPARRSAAPGADLAVAAADPSGAGRADDAGGATAAAAAVPSTGGAPAPPGAGGVADGGGPHGLRRVVRLLAAMVAGLAVLAALYAWFAPVNVPGNRGLPFGCGSPAHPNEDGLAAQLCGIPLAGSRAVALAGLLVAVVAGAAAAALAGGRAGRPAGRRSLVVLGLLVAAPLLATAALRLLVPTQERSSDGATVVDCGRAVAPTADAFAGGLCADAAGAHLGLGLALTGAALVLGVGVPAAVAAGSASRPGTVHT